MILVLILPGKRWYKTEEGLPTCTILFGKYRLDRMIGTGRTGTVWLAVHLGLDEYRAIKQVSKAIVAYEAFRREALILKSLRHPAIPIVYDLEEDQEFLYLIEEYLKGISLYTLMERQGVMQEAEAVHYGVQICRLVEFLHSQDEKPILYLDLQPNNLIICGSIVKIVDFGQAAYAGQSAPSAERYGTVGCAAPEQYTTDLNLDTRTDIYAIGAVLSYMVNQTLPLGQHSHGTVSRELGALIARCMEPDREMRFSTAGELERQLLRLIRPGTQEISHSSKNMPSLAAAVTGSRPGTGTTHLAIALCRHLNLCGWDTVYEEHNESGHVRCLADFYGVRPDGLGLYHMAGCRMKPWYGEAVSLDEPGAAVVVRDYGTDWAALKRDLGAGTVCVLMTAGGSPWQQRDCRRMLEALNPVQLKETGVRPVLVLRGLRSGVRAFTGGDKALMRAVKLFRSPAFDDPMKPGQDGTAFLKELWAAAAGGRPGAKERSWLGRCCTGRNAVRILRKMAGAGSSASSEPGGKQV